MVWSDHRVASLLPNSSAQFCGRVEWQVGIRGMAEAERSDERAPVVHYILLWVGSWRCSVSPRRCGVPE